MKQSAAAIVGTNNNADNLAVSASHLYSYESAVTALLSPGIHQSVTKEDIIKSSLRRTKTVSDMRYYWNKILKYNNHTNTNMNMNMNMNKHKKNRKNKKKPLLIHITGTKGKGSTACMCENILRSNGYKTGLFTSPHLINIRERIRYNGQPINEKLFNKVYWKIRHAFEVDESESEFSDDEVESSDLPPKLPGYFRMLTLMGMYTFLYELSGDNAVDVIILEVGMGGRYDATNFLDTTTTAASCYFQRVVYGVTLLDLDHTRILGTTLKQIAWEKGGIFSINKLNPNGISSVSSVSVKEETETDDNDKPSSTLSSSSTSSTSSTSLNKKYYILDSNTPEVINMMKSCARVEGGRGNGNEELVLVDSNGIKLKHALLSSSLDLGLAGNHQYGNATLALELCQAVTSTTSINSSTTRNNYDDDDDDDDDDVNNKRRRIANNKIELNASMTLNALSNATWPGRCQTLMWSSSSSSLPFDDDHNRSNKKKNVRFYLDGAHTPQSLDATVEWFRSKSNSSSSSSNGTGSGETDGGGRGSGGGDEKPQSSPPLLPILIFNCSHERNPVELLELLLKHQSGFSRVYFAQSDTSRPSPIAKASAESLLKERGITIREELLADEGKKTDDDSEGEIEGKMNTKTTTTTSTWQETLAIIWKHLLIQSTADTKSTSASASASALVSSSQTRDKDSSSIIRCNMTANEIVQEISLLVQQQQQKHRGDNDDDGDNDDSKTTLPLQEVFVTGSLYLVGSFLTALGWTEESSPTSPSPSSSSSSTLASTTIQ